MMDAPLIGPWQRVRTALLVVLIAVGLTALFWWPLWLGGGLVGGDVYTYYLPQKVVYAEQLSAGEFPLWNNRAGHGYPIVGESQTGPFYPSHLLFYSTLDLNTAYNTNHLLHYALTFLFTWMFARAVGLSGAAALLAALTFTYAWFPARSCWEWAIIGGAWMPLALWCVERFLHGLKWRYLILLSLTLAMQMLSGHFNLAFLTQLMLAAYIPVRVWFVRRDETREPVAAHRGRSFVMLTVAVLFGFALSSIQLVPTWELKKRSQRAAAGMNHPLAHGSIPAWYWSQAVRPWYWYSFHNLELRDRRLQDSEASLGAKTNRVEAHLYFGLVPLGLALAGVLVALGARNGLQIFWFAFGLIAFVYTSGRLVGFVESIPGLNFFQGPGRYGIITTLAVALLAGWAFDRLRASSSWAVVLYAAGVVTLAFWSSLTLTAQTQEITELAEQPSLLRIGRLEMTDGFVLMLLVVAVVLLLLAVWQTFSIRRNGPPPLFRNGVFTVCILSATLVDLWLVSRHVYYSEVVSDAPIDHLAESPVRQLLDRDQGTARLYALGANLPSALAASTPVYLTFGPAEYVDPKLTMPVRESPKQVAWLQRAGVTHVLSFEPLTIPLWPVALLWQGYDPLLNPALARYDQPLYLYRLDGSRGRVAWTEPQPEATAAITQITGNRVVIEAETPMPARLVLTDLMYPGWTVSIDGSPAEAIRFEGMYRAVDVPPGRHTITWTYRPLTVSLGACGSGVAFLLLVAVVVVRLRKLRLGRRLEMGDGVGGLGGATLSDAGRAGEIRSSGRGGDG